jgi:hypothetical protein
MTQNKLDYNYHLKQHESSINSLNQETKEYFICQAQQSHSYEVFNPLRDMGLISSRIVLKNTEASYYMLYGFSRRSFMIFYAYQSLIASIPPQRKIPLTFDEGTKLDSEINLIYMNIRGALDNLVTCYVYEREEKLINQLKPVEISMFSPKIKKMSENPAFWEKIFKFSSWEKEFKKKRDPVAHRMPLYAVRATLSDQNNDVEKFNQNIQKHTQQMNEGKFYEAGDTLEEALITGRFVPIFAHAPNILYPIYPTIPNDIAKLIEIFHIFRDELCKEG